MELIDKFKFLGVGGAFNAKEDCNSMYFTMGNIAVLVDCGEKIADKIYDMGLFKGVDKLYILITHFHSDHIASLGNLTYYTKDISLKPIIVSPKPKLIKRFLDLSSTGENLYEIRKPEEITDFEIVAVKQEHIPNSYGFFIKTKDFKVFYSGDTSVVNAEAVSQLKNGELDLIFHEVSESDFPIHTNIKKLEQSIPANLRDRVVCMHFSCDNTKIVAKNAGFKIAKMVERA